MKIIYGTYIKKQCLWALNNLKLILLRPTFLVGASVNGEPAAWNRFPQNI